MRPEKDESGIEALQETLLSTAPIKWLSEIKLAIADAEKAQPTKTPLTWREAPAARLA